jgi:hypothetical protein
MGKAAVAIELTEPERRELAALARPSDTFKLSTDPLFVEKVHDIVGLYMSRRGGGRSPRRWPASEAPRRWPRLALAATPRRLPVA